MVRTLDIAPVRGSHLRNVQVWHVFSRDAHSFTCAPTRSSAIGMNHIPAFAMYARESFSIRHKRYVFASVCVCLYVHRVTQKVAEKCR